MKKFILIFFVTLFSGFANAQRHPSFGVNNGSPNGPGPQGGNTGTNAWYGSPPQACGLAPVQFENLKRMICNQHFDDSRVSIAKQAIAGNSISSGQVKDLMFLLSFESSRLELAKFAYRFVVDPQNFYLLNDAFHFSSSIEELNDFVRRNDSHCGNTGMNQYFNGRQGNPGHCGTVVVQVGEYEFQKILSSIERKPFDDSKLSIAKQILNSNPLNSDQVKRIMNLFWFESTRLEFAKFAYFRVYDPQNYFVVNDTFVFNSSIDELNDYIF